MQLKSDSVKLSETTIGIGKNKIQFLKIFMGLSVKIVLIYIHSINFCALLTRSVAVLLRLLFIICYRGHGFFEFGLDLEKFCSKFFWSSTI